jgi:hypothetical protein
MASLRVPLRRRTRRTGAIVIATATSLTLLLTPAGAHGQEPLPDAPAPAGPEHEVLADLDTRETATAVAPTAAARELAGQLDATVRWSRFGTAQSLIRHGEFLTAGVPGADPAAAARTWLDDHRALYQLGSTDELRVDATVPVSGNGYAVVFRQYVAGRPVSPDGIATVGLVGSAASGWSVAYASATLVPQPARTALAAAPSLTTRKAFTEAAADTGTDVDSTDVTMDGVRAGWRVLDVAGLDHEQLARPVAFPTATAGIRPAFETIYYDGAEAGYRYIVDAQTGAVLYREGIVHHADDNPTWDVYPSQPPTTRLARPPWQFPGVDRRDLWCWTDFPQCDLALANDAARVPWDVDAATGLPTFTTSGNSVTAFESWNGDVGQHPVSDQRDYRFPWTNVWYETRCDSANLVPGGNDIDASVANLFANNWRMHDWGYHLGFTEETWNAQAVNFGINPDGEGDPVLARAQAGAISPGSRNNATMATRPDGTSSIMSMFLWQPQANSFYGPCVVGDYDMSVIGHEYTHMIENRLIGKGGGRSGFHAGAMGESWSDFISMEYQNEYRPVGGDRHEPWTVGAYATGNPDRGIRNFNMAFPPAGKFPQQIRDVRVGAINFGAMGYDIVGPQVHADSQIWSATNHDIRSLLLDRYPSQGATQQRECADGLRPAEACPGNRRWIQLVFDAMLLMPTAPTMLDARDAYFAADLMRFGGDNQDLLWLGFARRGFGENASVEGTQDTDPVPSFESPMHEEATVTFETVAKDESGQPVEADVFVGDYEARATAIQSVERFVPNPEGYNFNARADGYGQVRFFVDDLQAGQDRTIRIEMPTNVASVAQGATASGDGIRHADLIDDTEGTNWQSAPEQPNTVTVDPPSAAAGQYGAAGAAFGPAPTEAGLAGEIVLASDGTDTPTDACEPLVGFPAGTIALVDRGTCGFTQKVSNAQAAGATAVIVANNVPGDPFEMGGADASIVIPSVMVSLDDGTTIRDGLPATGSVASAGSVPVQGVQVTVALDGEQSFRLAKASAMLLPGQNRFTALRQFELYACTAGNSANPTCDGSTDAGWQRFLRSHRDAFPAPNPRPSAPDLAMRTFEIPNRSATHVKLVVLANQCTGNPNYQGDQHDDPAAPTSDCRSTPVGAEEVRAAELQLLTSKPRVDGATLVE